MADGARKVISGSGLPLGDAQNPPSRLDPSSLALGMSPLEPSPGKEQILAGDRSRQILASGKRSRIVRGGAKPAPRRLD